MNRPPSVAVLLSFVLAATPVAIAQHGAPLPVDEKTRSWVPPAKTLDPEEATLPTGVPGAFAPAHAQARLPEHASVIAESRFDTVVWDERGGVSWALGHTYKASFDANGMTFVPYFGPAAPRNFPIRFAVASIQLGTDLLPVEASNAPQRERDRVRIPRGACSEVFDLDLDSVEQSFVFGNVPATGDLQVVLRAETELLPVATADGLEFRGSHGTVVYRKAVVFDAAGVREDLAIELARDNSIRLRVSRRFLAAATGPITIDPQIATFSPSVATSLDFHADVASLPGTGVVVWQRVFSGNDHDVFVRWLAAGTLQTIDFTGENWEQPRIATNTSTGTAMIVAQVGLPWLTRVVKCRFTTAAGMPGAVFQVSGAEAGEAINCDVGGDSSGITNSVFCVVWERQFSSSDRDILFRTVSPFGFFSSAGSLPVDTSGGTFDTRPRISKTNGVQVTGAVRSWPIVWQRRHNLGPDEDVRGALIDSSGALVVPSFSIDFSGARDTNPVVSSPTVPFAGGRTFLVAYERAMPTGDSNIIARVLRGSSLVSGPHDLSQLGDPATALQDQIRPAVDSDGLRFVVAHGQRVPGAPTGDNDVLTATWALSPGLTLREPPRILGSLFGSPELNPSVAHFAGTTAHFVMFERVNASLDRDIVGAAFDANIGALSTVMTGCIFPLIAHTLPPPIPITPGMTITGAFSAPPPSPVVNQFIAIGVPAPTVFCPFCVLGVDLATATIVPGLTFSFTIPVDPRLVGTMLALQGIGDMAPIPGWPYTTCQDRFTTLSHYVLVPIN